MDLNGLTPIAISGIMLWYINSENSFGRCFITTVKKKQLSELLYAREIVIAYRYFLLKII